MNRKLLYTSTVAISLLGSMAIANPAFAAEPLTRAQVRADLDQAIANGTLQRTDYDSYGFDTAAVSTKSRAQVLSEQADAKVARSRLVGSEANGLYNPFGTETHRPTVLTRAEVKADVLQAAADGTLPRTDYDYDAQVVSQRVHAKAAAAARYAKRSKASQGSEG